jgi:hypothetical protein
MTASTPKRRKLRNRLSGALYRGRCWTACYWRQDFEYDHEVATVAAIPAYLLRLVEAGKMSQAALVGLMAARATSQSPQISNALWDEAVSFALGVREDARRAAACGDAAVAMAEEGRWMDAFHAARQAHLLEAQYVTKTRYWHSLLYTLARELVALGHGTHHPFLRSFAQAPPGDPTARRVRRGRPERGGGQPARLRQR